MTLLENNWIEWKGGECPVEAGTLVDVRYRDGEENLHVEASVPATQSGSMKSRSAKNWSHLFFSSDIVAYRLHQPEIKRLIAKRDKQAEKVKRQTAKLDRLNEEIKQAIAQLENKVERNTGLCCKIYEQGASDTKVL